MAIVTGAAAGTGRVIARRLAEEGARVVLADVDEAGGTRTADEIGGAFVRADMTDPDAIGPMV